MKTKIEDFVLLIQEFDSLAPKDKIDYFVYFLTEIENEEGVTATRVKQCFDELHMAPYSNISKYITENLKNKFIRLKDRYYLEANRKKEIKSLLEIDIYKTVAKKSLNNLTDKLTIESEKEFLREAIICFNVGAYRASVIMVWILTIEHMNNYVYNNNLAAFNSALSRAPEKKLKELIVNSKDDFSDISESKLIELWRSANIITNDIRKILDEKLGIRNSSGHPSSVIILESKAIEFIEDLVTNVILKYN